MCADIDECQAGVSAVCGANALACTDTVGSFSCTCRSGYRWTGKACDGNQTAVVAVVLLCCVHGARLFSSRTKLIICYGGAEHNSSAENNCMKGRM